MTALKFPITAAIEIKTYQTHWPAEFDRIKIDLEQLIGSLALRIDHIGSTSVPGLAAKDIIDIQITVASLESQELIELLRKSEYELLENYRDQIETWPLNSPQLAKLFLKNKPGQRRANIHIRQAGFINQEYALLFRDYLRQHPEACDIYCLLKQRISQIFPRQIEGYYYLKDPLMDLIYLQAKFWAQKTE